MEGWSRSALLIAGTVALVIVNGFFVAAEFALVKIRITRLVEMQREGRAFTSTAIWLSRRLDQSLSACQLGITMASLGLGWIGEPAVARLIEPAFHAAGIQSAALIHTVSFTLAFTVITAAHLVIGEQAPKIFAIRQPERMALWCAMPLKAFYVASYPLLLMLNAATTVLLRRFGVEGSSAHEAPHSEEEIRVLLSQSRAIGELTRSEHRLLDAVFEFDETLSRQIMVPRVEVIYIDASKPFRDAVLLARRTQHTRYPVCAGSLDEVLGVVHVKDLTGLSEHDDIDIRKHMRPPRFVPETMPIPRLLGHFQATRQHMAFVLDEYGSVIGIVTLENVLERIVGPVEDEFDLETPDVVPDGPRRFLVQGGTPLGVVNRKLGLELDSAEVDTLGGLIMERLGRVATTGDEVGLVGATAEVVETRGARATRVRITMAGDEPADDLDGIGRS